MLHNINKVVGYENLTTDELHNKLAETQKDLDKYNDCFEARDPRGNSQPPYFMTAIIDNLKSEVALIKNEIDKRSQLKMNQRI